MSEINAHGATTECGIGVCLMMECKSKMEAALSAVKSRSSNTKRVTSKPTASGPRRATRYMLHAATGSAIMNVFSKESELAFGKPLDVGYLARRRRRFVHEWDEIVYLNRRMLLLILVRRNPRAARQLVAKLLGLLASVDSNQEAILGQECRCIAAYLVGNFQLAAQHCSKGIRLVKRFLRVARNVRHYMNDSLPMRYCVLAALNELAGKHAAAETAVLAAERAAGGAGPRKRQAYYREFISLKHPRPRSPTLANSPTEPR